MSFLNKNPYICHIFYITIKNCMTMKKMIICLLALVVCSTIEAQRLVAFKG